jgi:hypothetical protein
VRRVFYLPVQPHREKERPLRQRNGKRPKRMTSKKPEMYIGIEAGGMKMEKIERKDKEEHFSIKWKGCLTL